uniref:MIB/HERC2 domain-containing protein n=1 Tax=Biomphalaria glabrata TaxID=6526 RepID=A0A2C9K796_BIOGL
KASEEPLNGLEQLLEFSSMLLDPILGLLAQTATSTCQATIRKGCRVVRGPDWKWAEQDGGEGHTGTILQHTPQKKHVVVLWDSGECCEYRVGDRERFDLRLLDSAPAGKDFVPVPARLNSEKIAVVGMAPGAKVQRGKFWKSGNID